MLILEQELRYYLPNRLSEVGRPALEKAAYWRVVSAEAASRLVVDICHLNGWNFFLQHSVQLLVRTLIISFFFDHPSFHGKIWVGSTAKNYLLNYFHEKNPAKIQLTGKSSRVGDIPSKRSPSSR